MNEIIALSEVSFGYDKSRNVLQQISFTAEAADAIGLIGANGAGKSTLLKLLVGLSVGYSGSIRILDVEVSRAGKEKTLPFIRERVGYVFQDSESQMFMPTVYEDVAFAPRGYGLPPEEAERRAQQAMELVHIAHLRHRPIYQLSGGEKKLASIASILSMKPDIILMDEPSIALDPKNRRNLIHILNQLPQLKIIASHDLDLILDTCQRAILLSEGRIIADGPAEQILRDRELLEAHNLELPLCMQCHLPLTQ